MSQFIPVPGPFADALPDSIDEAATQERFVEFVGGRQRADRLHRLWQNSHPTGTAYDELMGRGKTRVEVFSRKAKREGFTNSQIDAFLSL